MPTQKDAVKSNIQRSQEASRTSRYVKGGLFEGRVKLSSKNFDKLMKQRGIAKNDRAEIKASAKKGTPMQIRHAKIGEKFVTTHGTERSSGMFVSKKSLGNTPFERINKGALPHTNSAVYETKVELAKNQNLVYSKIASQSKFSKMDPKKIPRSGGGEQVITDGGYNSGAIINKDPKYPTLAKDDFQRRVNSYKEKKLTKAFTESNAKCQKKSNGQAL